MRRVRITFVLLSLAFAGAAAIVLQRALASVESERAAQRSAVAERVFDEMERALTRFLDEQESLGSAAWLSPPAQDPAFVAGRFETGPGDAVRLAAGSAAGLAPQLSAWAARRAAPRANARRDEGGRDAASLGEAGAPEQSERKAAAGAPIAQSPRGVQDSVYGALQSLNRGAEERAQRARKIEMLADAAPPARDGAYSGEAQRQQGLRERGAAEAGSLASAPREKDAIAAAEPPAPPAREPEEPGRARERAAAPAGPATEALAHRQAGAPSRAPAPARAEPEAPLAPAAQTRVAVDPLLGDALDARRLVLARTVLAGERGYRQGLVLDVAPLGEWLRERGLGDGALPGAQVAFAVAGAAVPAAPDAFAHRFAEPFDALAASLALPALPDSGSARAIVRLSLLFAAAAAAALFALYRMVTVALRFAEQRSRFVASVSHELKTPLTAIRMYGEMLRDGLVPTDEKRAEYYRTITGESERLSRLIDNVLEFARSEREEAPLALRSGRLGDDLASLCEALRPHAAEAGFTLELSAATDAPAVAYDRDAVAQIVVNLVDNALKYARSASHRVVRVICSSDGDGVALRVRDFGPGVAPRDLERIFELFRRGEGEAARATRGTGLGLALVRSLARRMGAQVSARNADGGGLEVRVVFPRSARG